MTLTNRMRADDTSIPEGREVLGDGRLGQRQVGEDFGAATFLLSGEKSNDVETCRMSQRFGYCGKCDVVQG